jgi:hypothetical protein
MTWIKIIESDINTLPDFNTPVLCLSEEGDMSVEKRANKQNFIYCEQTDSGCATHWMELPTYPLD